MDRYDIFISYKRKSLPTADNLYYRLTKRGYSTFLDLEEMRRDNFNVQLLNYIENAKDVFVILEEGSLDACTKVDWEKDWFCHEIAFALEKKKNIIPILLNGFKMPSGEFFPNKMKELSFKNAPEFNYSFFEAYLDKLVEKNYLLSKPKHRIDDASIEKLIKDRIEHVISSQDILHQTELHINVDAECKLFLFNKFKQQLEADKEHIIYLLPGTHKLSFVSTEIPEVRISKVLDLKADKEKEYIKILLKEETTRKAEEEASRSETLSILNKFFGNRKSEEEKKETLYKYGLALSEKKKDYEAFILYKRAASAGHAHSQYLMGIYYSKTKKYPEAFEWFKKAAEQNHPEAQYSIGKFYYNGYTGKTDYSEALKWFRKAADNNNYKAHNMIGIMYEEGKGIPQNFNSAFDHYFFAGKMGNAIAQYNIGRLIELEKVSHYSLSKSDALHWFKEAAKKGNKDAISKLKDLKESY